MARLTTKQKKERNSFITMLIAIVIVIAAIAYVLFGGLTAKSSLLENQDFASALSKMLDKAPAFITAEDLAQVKYISLNYSSDEEVASVTIGDEAFVDMYTEYLEKLDASEDVSSYDFTGTYKYIDFDMDKEDALLDDIKLFTGARILEIAGVSFTDSSVFAGLTDLEDVTVKACGLTEVAGLGGLNPEKVSNVNLSGNNITDWSPLDIIKDKVIVNTYYTLVPTEDGSFDFNNVQLVEQTLTEYYEELAAAEEAEKAEDAAEVSEETINTDAEVSE